MTEVVAALIWDSDRFLICQRPAHKARGLLWEFVGGKIEPGETAKAALIRECREELDVTIEVGSVFMEVIHTYPDLTVHLTLFHATISDGTPKLLEHNDIRWIHVGEIEQYAFCPADEEILEKIKLNYSSGAAIVHKLFDLQDPTYRRFMQRLIPTLEPDRIIGVRMPDLRKLARSEAITHEYTPFIVHLPHYFYEEYNLHTLWINRLSDYNQMVDSLNRFLPYVDNWSTCDLLRPSLRREDREKFLPHIQAWLHSSHPYTIRFAIEMLMVHYLGDAFKPDSPEWISVISSSEYYVNMMTAWYFAEALHRQTDVALKYLTEHRLPVWTHNKAIQKALESRKISAELKNKLRELKRLSGNHK